ncbi:sensor histidine kinase [Kocuria coralli]|uniref:Sensor histidine kinase n=1 Tax=Kocuria coralli TaxID=1461025 RepID=A0A5J5L2D1_9MICC|nr:sensor histidine kinase [Kocuria coralli]KAA9395708.1 sensor histidine kinase [Kocuria coralli]
MTDLRSRPRTAASATPDRPLIAMHLSVDIGFAVLLVVCALRYFAYHPFNGVGVAVLALASGSGACYALAVISRFVLRRQQLGIILAAVLWLPLAVLAPSFAWCAFPLFFALRRVLRRRAALIGSAMVVLAVSVGLFLMSNGEDLGLVLGPFFGGLTLSFAVDALEQALENRGRLNAELLRTQEQLARSEREAGALAERNRFASELHDTVVQRTASALILLQSEDERETGTPETVAEAREVLRESLIETRQLVHGLTRPQGSSSLTSDIAALARDHEAKQTTVGTEVAVDAEVAHALLRVVQEALINAGKHARASSIRVTVTFFGRSVGVDIADDGIGFEPDAVQEDTGGYGLRAMAWRMESLGGTFTVESTPGRGTVVAGIVPIPFKDGEDR